MECLSSPEIVFSLIFPYDWVNLELIDVTNHPMQLFAWEMIMCTVSSPGSKSQTQYFNGNKVHILQIYVTLWFCFPSHIALHFFCES